MEVGVVGSEMGDSEFGVVGAFEEGDAIPMDFEGSGETETLRAGGKFAG